MKVIFLDIDGVLRTNMCSGAVMSIKDKPGRPIVVEKLDPRCIDQLNRVISQTGAKIVLSSSWRYLFRDYMNLFQKFLNQHGAIGEVIGRTPVFSEYSLNTPAGYVIVEELPRGKEIQLWLDKHPDVEKFVIVDDMSNMEHLTNKLVNTKFEVGITEEDANKMIEILR